MTGALAEGDCGAAGAELEAAGGALAAAGVALAAGGGGLNRYATLLHALALAASAAAVSVTRIVRFTSQLP